MKFEKDPFNLIICGVGGQGNILLSRMISRILSNKDYLVTIGETFGAAQRGGSVHSSVRISKLRQYGPLIPEGHGHLVLGLEPLEALRVLSVFGSTNVVTVTNTEAVYPVGVLAKRFNYPDLEELKDAIRALSRDSCFLNATAIAIELNSPIVANIIMLGAVTATKKLPISIQEIEEEIRRSFPSSKVDLNLEALTRGVAAISDG